MHIKMRYRLAVIIPKENILYILLKASVLGNNFTKTYNYNNNNNKNIEKDKKLLILRSVYNHYYYILFHSLSLLVLKL